jgi:uncharacterized MAPEG superfamily protein
MTLPGAMAIEAMSILVPVLLLKVFATNMLQGKAQRAAGMGPKEDWNNAEQSKVAQDHIANANRWLRITNNDTENVPYGLLAMILTAFTVPGASAIAQAQIAFSTLYVLCRTAHTVAFAFEKQPHRTIFFLLGQICFFTLLLILPISVFGRASL